MTQIGITDEPVDVEVITREVWSERCGAVVTFVGIVRSRADDGREVDGLTYEAHAAMALDVFSTIVAEARERFGECEIAIVHRIGALRVGDVAVAVTVASAHRADAFDACEYAIDALKARAPIWKKEHYTDGSAEWRENACRGEGVH